MKKGEGAILLERFVLDMLRQLAHGLAEQFGPSCEVEVREVDPVRLVSRGVVLENGHVSGGRESQTLPLVRDAATRRDELACVSKTPDGRTLKRSTLYLRDSRGAVCALFTVSYDLTELFAAEESLRAVLPVEQLRQRSGEDTVFCSVSELLENLIAEAVRLIGKPAAEMTKEEKIRAIRFLNDAGAFLVTRSGDRITKEFGISKFTLYSYIDAGKET